MTKTRSKIVAENYGGTCHGTNRTIENCKLKECPGIMILLPTSKNLSTYLLKISPFFYTKLNLFSFSYKVNCQWGEWGNWTSCSSECKGGIRTRNRLVHNKMQHDGEDCVLAECKGFESGENCQSQKQDCNEEIECPST